MVLQPVDAMDNAWDHRLLRHRQKHSDVAVHLACTSLIANTVNENSTLSLDETEKILLQVDLDRYISERELFEAKNLARVGFVVRVNGYGWENGDHGGAGRQGINQQLSQALGIFGGERNHHSF